VGVGAQKADGVSRRLDIALPAIEAAHAYRVLQAAADLLQSGHGGRH
jgi:hypothetical protein